VGLLKAGVPADSDDADTDGLIPADAPVPLLIPSAPSSQSEWSFPDFAAALRSALRDYSRVDLLAANPLLRSRLLTRRGQVNAANLQALLSETVDTLFASPRDEKLRRVIELTYFRPAPKQEAAADRLSLSFGTYPPPPDDRARAPRSMAMGSGKNDGDVARGKAPDWSAVGRIVQEDRSIALLTRYRHVLQSKLSCDGANDAGNVVCYRR